MLKVVQFRGIAATAFKNTKPLICVVMQRFSVDQFRRDDRDVMINELLRELMLLENLLILPSPRPVKLGDDRCAVLDPYLIDPIFVAVEGK